MTPFTANQWQELEQQALIYKYLVSGLPIPSDLILPIKKSFLFGLPTPTTCSNNFTWIPPHPTNFASPDGWGYFPMGSGRRTEDPEPGRCRRTDGKKWRCAREAYGDSKYCERHMHRGKNRSRKLVELSLSTTTTPINSNNNNNHNHNSSNTYSSSSASGTHHYHPHPFYPTNATSNTTNTSIASSLRPASSFIGLNAHEQFKGNATIPCLGTVLPALAYENNRTFYAATRELDEQKLSLDRLGCDGNDQQNLLTNCSDFKRERGERPRSFHCFLDELPRR